VRFFCFVVALSFFVVWNGEAFGASDPRLKYKQIDTPHFRVTFYSGEDEIAQRVADLAESIHARLVPAIGWPPSERTEIAITDMTDSANAFATALPYDSIHMYATPPDDLSPLGDVDDWYGTLITHEYTHVLHTDHIRGLPSLVNAIIGKTIAPNQIEPRWMLEGLAVFEETEKTSGGRLRSPTWNMYMRADVLENNVATLDEFSNTPRRFPQGNLWYLYGSFFMQWIAETYGQEAIRMMIDDYGHQLIPYGINRSLKRVTGRTFEDLYPSWVDTMRREFGAQRDKVKARGIREGKRLTFGGQGSFNPRWVPTNAWAHKGDAFVYFRDDGHEAGGLAMVPIERDATGAITGAHDDKREMLIRTAGGAYASFLPNGSIVFDSAAVYNNLFLYDDLFLMEPGAKGTLGVEMNRKRLTNGWRATQPDVSRDGRQITFVTNTRGTSYLQIAELHDGTIENVRALVPSGPFDLAYSPHFSPDGTSVAYSSWHRGGYRDVRVVDVTTGKIREIARDRAIDGGPTFTPDGKYVLFHSDRVLGIMNIFAWELATGTLKQVTNVVNGAFQPTVSPDGKTIFYSGYTCKGHDIYGMAFDPSQWLDVPPYVDDRPPAVSEPVHHKWEVRDYNPWPTLRPRHYSFNILPGNFGGQALQMSINTSDVAGIHSFSLSLLDEFEHPDLQINAGYTYGRLPFDLGVSAARSVGPANFQIGQSYKPAYAEEALGVQTSIAYSVPTAFDNHSFGLSHSLSRIGQQLPAYASKLDPYETPQLPQAGQVSSLLHLTWGYSNAVRPLWSVGPEKGFSANASLEVTDPVIGSDYRGVRAAANFSTYFLMPWGRWSRHLRHHSLGFHAGGGAAGGTLPGAGPFYVGGFVDVNLIDEVRNLLNQGAFVLRGYPTVSQVGSYYGLFNLEYRFPIWNIDRGPSTVPLFLNRISGAGFVDYGGAFNTAETAKFRTGIGGELWTEFTLGYVVTMNFRLGYARGLATGGIDKLYFVASFPF
jgi:hypothetical protein